MIVSGAGLVASGGTCSGACAGVWIAGHTMTMSAVTTTLIRDAQAYERGEMGGWEYGIRTGLNGVTTIPYIGFPSSLMTFTWDTGHALNDDFGITDKVGDAADTAWGGIEDGVGYLWDHKPW